MNGFDLHFSAVIQAAFLLLFLKSPHLASWFACRIVTPAFTKLNWITKVWVMFSKSTRRLFHRPTLLGQTKSLQWSEKMPFGSSFFSRQLVPRSLQVVPLPYAKNFILPIHKSCNPKVGRLRRCFHWGWNRCFLDSLRPAYFQFICSAWRICQVIRNPLLTATNKAWENWTSTKS